MSYLGVKPAFAGNRGIIDTFTGDGDSPTANAYMKYENGFIIQWGFAALSAGSTTLTWPVTFPTSCFRAVGFKTPSGDQSAKICSNTEPSASNWTNIDVATDGTYNWIAVGN